MPWDAVHVFSCPTQVHYGWGAAALVGEQLRALSVRRALLVTDAGVQGAGLAARIADAIAEAGLHVAVYAGTRPNPTVENVGDAVALWRSERCDGVVGLGGGSAMDAAKGAATVAANGGDIRDYVGRNRIPLDLPPLVCLPTTCGTGSEVTFNAVISDEERHIKLPFVSAKLAPRVALVDPDLVVSAPATIIAATAADALCHAIESYINRGSDPFLDALNLSAIQAIGTHLDAAVHERDREAIARLALASTMAGVAFNMNANAIVHAASTPVTARHGVAHGVANAIFLAPGLRFCLPAAADRLREVAVALGAAHPADPEAHAAERGIEAIGALFARVGLPASLRAAGVDPSAMDLDALADDAMTSRNIAANPRPVSRADIIALYQEVAG